MAFGITEPDAGSNTHRLATTAPRDGDDYRLNGQKYYISASSRPTAWLVVARTATTMARATARAVAVPRRPRPARASSGSRSRSR